MAISRAFEIAELIRHFKYDSTNDVIVTEKRTQDKNKKRGAETKTSTSQFALDTFAKADFRAARYILAMSVHDGSVVTMTQYGTLKDANLATIDADISGANVRLLVTPASATSTVIKFDRTLVEA